MLDREPLLGGVRHYLDYYIVTRLVCSVIINYYAHLYAVSNSFFHHISFAIASIIREVFSSSDLLMTP
jgi:hypothetical protein